MNCRDIEHLLLAERDGVLTEAQHASLERHVASCAGCQELRFRLNATMSAFKAEIASAPVPNIDEEWKKLRAQLQGPQTKPTRPRRLAPVIWLATPLAAAAALAFAYFGRQAPLQPKKQETPDSMATVVVASTPEVAQAEYVEAGNANASTMVYVDKESGWLVVWAVDGDAKGSG